jgi:hypothetical protein
MSAHAPLTFKQQFRRVYYSFPIQLFFLHLKHNHLLLVVWLVLFGYVTQTLSIKFGVPFLFLFPEYLGEVTPLSFALLGFSCGGFIMAFNIYSYVLHGYKFPFIATISKPFLKFCINNFILPALFILIYIYQTASFQLNNELVPTGEMIGNVFGFLGGMTIFFVVSGYYFFRTNKDLFKISGKSEAHFEDMQKDKPFKASLHKKAKWYKRILRPDRGWHIETYFSGPFRIKLARDSSHYDEGLLKQVFSQNHINASIFEIAIVLSFLMIGSFREVPMFMIPAGASIFLLFTIFVMILSAFYSWFKGWTVTVLLLLFLMINFASTHFDFMRLKNYAYGLNYNTEKADYSRKHLEDLRANKTNYKADFDNTVAILNQWKAKNSVSPDEKPPLIIVNTSGGGLRASLWTFHALQYIDSLSQGNLMSHTQMITGASGGMVGAAYLREVYLRHQQKPSFPYYSKKYRNNISKDILNPIAFSIATNDIFIRYQTYDDGKYTYTKDRGYAFEKQLNSNTNYILDKRLRDYRKPEQQALIPMMIFSPTIINDGRRLLISSQPISYLSNNIPDLNVRTNAGVENVEFTRLFAKQDAWNLHFTSALRMNATFPYIMPMVSLPTTPHIEVMDAGIRDNYGIKTSIQYVYTFRKWIEENTSRVILIQLRDQQKNMGEVKGKTASLFSRLLAPFGVFYDNFTSVQDFNHDQLIQHSSSWFGGNLEVITISLPHHDEEPISLSWHLTKLEKRKVLRSIHRKQNKVAIQRLLELLQ